jgi:simple sugar transport system permease protein
MANLTQTKEPLTLRKILNNSIVSYTLAVLIALIASGIFIALMGYDVLKAFQTIFTVSFRTPNGFIQTLLKFIPLTLIALAFTVPLTTGKFNIGGEGQLLVGAIAATTVGILLKDLPAILLLPLVLLTGALAGGLWGLIPGWLLYRFRINEILTTVLLNFVSFALLNYVATEVFPDQAAGHPTTIPIGKGGWLPMLVANPPLHSGLILMLLVAVIIYFYTNRTTAGYELVATGANPRAASVFGINVRVMFVLGLVVGGALAGLAGGIEVAGVHHNLIEGMQSNFQALGLVIGLISKGSSLAVPFVAFFISILEVGASAMQRTMGIPVEVVFIVEALILIFVLMADVVRRK